MAGEEEVPAGGTEPLALRAMQSELGLLGADGSAQFSQGQTCVLAAVYGPGDVSVRRELADRATLQIILKPKTGLPAVRERDYEQMVQHALEDVVLGHLHPRSSIMVVLQVKRDDGSLLSCALNAACLALMDAGISLRCTLAAVSCCQIASGLDASYTTLVLDPDMDQTTAAVSTFHFVMPSDASNDVLACWCLGRYSRAQFVEANKLAQEAARSITTFFRLTQERRLAKAGLGLKAPATKAAKAAKT